MIEDNLVFERQYFSEACKYIAGVDEVGRGPLAGNVVCACVIMPMDDIIAGVTDSKKLSEKKREMLFELIMEKAIAVSIAEISPKKIDEINILNATKLCMKNAVDNLAVKPDILFVDALKLDVDVKQLSLIKGDLLSYTIGAASIVAKVTRDRQMVEYSKIYPNYGFEKHKGYGTKQHIEALRGYGECEIHRQSFIKNFVKKDKI